MAKTNMIRAHCRYWRGERLRMGAPHRHWNINTVIGALTLPGMIALFVISGPINRTPFVVSVEQVPVPEL